MLTKEEKEKVETRIAKLEAEIAEDKLKDKMIDDDMEQMVQTTLTVYEGVYRVSSKTVPTWLFALLLASTHTNCKSF